jgi:cytochrome oxidase Cu insertion factor (SCO1/SenC/PrrC family)
MNSGGNAAQGTVVSAFHSALASQGAVALGLVLVVLLAVNVVRALRLRDALRSGLRPVPSAVEPEAIARRFLRYGFGVLWILDGLLQLQPAMPLGMVSQVIQPASSGSPSFVHSLVNAGTTIWSYHPVTAAAATVWIQIGIGAWLIVGPRGAWSRLAGGASCAWGLVVWIFGEAFGGIFNSGVTWLFGAPGAAAFYCVAGALVALPERCFASPRLGRRVLGAAGLFFAGMGVLQAWPGRGSWQGRSGNLSSMASQMATTPQPGWLASMVRAFSSFDASNGFAVNLFAVAMLLAIGVGLLSGRPALARAAVIAAGVLCLADWIFVEDIGVFGGVGTDPNSMIPMWLLLMGGYLALVRPAAVAAPVEQPERRPFPLSALAAAGAAALVLFGAVPMAVAAVTPTADPILNEAVNGNVNTTDAPAPAFDLVDAAGKAVSLGSLHGKVVVLTFLDPVCTSDCPLLAQEMRETDTALGGAGRQVEFVAVVANPVYRSAAAMTAFDNAEGLSRLDNWTFLTGSLPALEHTWNAYGIQVATEPGGSMVAHSDIVYVIDANGHTRSILGADPGAGDAAMRSSFSGVLTAAIKAAGAGR